MFKGLADPTRLRIMHLLVDGECCVCDLMEGLDLPQSTVSRHLATLKGAGWVTGRRAGVWTYYTVADDRAQSMALLLRLWPGVPELAEDLARMRRFMQQKPPQKCNEEGAIESQDTKQGEAAMSTLGKKTALFICVHNSARSQMAEEYLKKFGGDDWHVESAGFEPGEINPLVIEAMKEEDIFLEGKGTQSVFELFKKGKTFSYVVTVCEESEGGECPIFPGMTHRMHLPFPDPSKLEGGHDEKLAKVREIRDHIKDMIKGFLEWEVSGGKRPLGDFWDISK